MCKFHAVGGAMDTTQGREILPANVIPRHYNLTLEPDLKNLTFEGTVIIDLDVVEDSTSISINSLDLEIHNVSISDVNSLDNINTITYDEAKQTTKVALPRMLPKGSEVQLKMTFQGELNDKMAGFYRSTYKRADGSESVMAVTQMESTDARRAFPCFDEPALKAKFTVTLIAEQHLTCLSNMDIASESNVNSSGIIKKAVKFNTSPLMSTYLIAFVVGELHYMETTTFRVPIRVYAPINETISHGKFALELAAKTLAYYEEIFDSPYPLPKLDQVAVPDFEPGAMENWGLVIYRLSELLFDEENGGAAVREEVADTVQHELAHQWFGNLVTMDFWDGLWLNEGFATWMAWYSSNIFFPDWKIKEGFVMSILPKALNLDSLRSSHPIEVPINRADEIEQIFDAISYNKGACVIRMIAAYLGEEEFLKGVRLYLKKHAYGNTETGDLWTALSATSGKPVHQIMGLWTKELGYPVVTVTTAGPDSIRVKQNRFLQTGDVKTTEDEVIFPILLSIRTKSDIMEVMFQERETVIEIPGVNFKDNKSFFKLNTDHTGFYRTLYSSEHVEILGEAAKDGLLSVEDRAGLVADAAALAISGYQTTSAFLNLLKGFNSEPDFIVWSGILSTMTRLQRAWAFEDEFVTQGLEAFVRELVSVKTHSYGWRFDEGDDHTVQQFKALLFGHAGQSGNPIVIDAAKDMLSKYSEDKTAIHPNLRKEVFSIAIQHGGIAEYNAVLDVYQTSDDASEKEEALGSLGSVRSPDLIQKTLALAMSKEVKEQDITLPLMGLQGHPKGITAMFEWLKTNWDVLLSKFKEGAFIFGSVVNITTKNFSTEKHLAMLEEFFSQRNTRAFEKQLAQSYDSIRANSSWLKRDRADVATWVKENRFSI